MRDGRVNSSWKELSTSAMGKFFSFLPLLLVLTGVLLICERPAYGYTDPGTGLLAIQAVGSALIAAGWYLRRKISSLFRREETSSPEVKDGEGTNLP
jgi:hypothetical protein